MKISAIYIAKNEAHNIARSLESVKEAVDELILVDTGSTDDTVKIFEAYGGVVYYQPWEDDFSAPRNLALSKATGDWIIILDADESFTPETRNNIKGVLEAADAATNGLMIRLVNFDKDTGEKQDELYTLRITRNIPNLNYRGRIHERLCIGSEDFSAMQLVSPELLSINHTGYSSSLTKVKGERNLRMILADLEDGEPVEKYYTYLHETYALLGDMERAIHYAKLDVAAGRQNASYASRSYRGLMRHYAKDFSKEGREQRIKVVRKAVQDFPELPDFHAEYSECLYQFGDYRGAKREIDLAVSLYVGYNGLEPCLLTDDMLCIMQRRQQEMSKKAAEGINIAISACVIVKNEENNILAWLQNVSVFADEIIIADTGSVDTTKEIIQAFSEKHPDMPIILIEAEWADDFSFARNQALAEASGDWIVFTDADELFELPEYLRGYLAMEVATDIQAIMVPMDNVDAANGGSVVNRFNPVRIVRREDGLHYEGRIHEGVAIGEKSIDKLNWVVADTRLLMIHTGYSSNITKAKARRNLNLLLMDIKDGQDIRKMYRYLAECYSILEKHEQALENALLAIQSDYQPIGQAGDMYWLALNTMEKLGYGTEDRLAIAENGIRLFKDLPDFYGRKGLIKLEEKDYAASRTLLEKALTLQKQYAAAQYNKNSSSMQSIIHEVYAALGTCCYKTGYSRMAEECFRQALSINKWCDKAICAWADVYQGRCEEAYLEGLEEFYQSEKDYETVLAKIFAVNGFPELAEYYGHKQSMVNNPSYECIYKESMREIADIISPLFVCLLGHYNNEYIKLLPEKAQILVKHYHEIIAGEKLKDCFTEYIAFLGDVVSYGSDEILKKYIHMLYDFSDMEEEQLAQIISAADTLLQKDHYQMALDLYQMIPADSDSVNSEFWQNAGICFYNMQMYAEALGCLEKSDRTARTDSYIAWCREAMGNDN